MKAVVSRLTYKAGKIKEIFPKTGYSNDDVMLIFIDDSYHRIRRSIYNIDQTTSDHIMFVLDSQGKYSFLTEEEFNSLYENAPECQS